MCVFCLFHIPCATFCVRWKEILRSLFGDLLVLICVCNKYYIYFHEHRFVAMFVINMLSTWLFFSVWYLLYGCFVDWSSFWCFCCCCCFPFGISHNFLLLLFTTLSYCVYGKSHTNLTRSKSAGFLRISKIVWNFFIHYRRRRRSRRRRHRLFSKSRATQKHNH